MKTALSISVLLITLQSCAWTPEQRAQFARGASGIVNQPTQQPYYYGGNGAAPLVRAPASQQCNTYCQELKRQQEELIRQQQMRQYIKEIKSPYGY